MTERTTNGSWRDKAVVVTGAGGFIGSHLVERLLGDGARVVAFVHYNSRNDRGFLSGLSDANDALRVVSGDITDLAAVRKACEGAEVVFHLAALVGIPYSYVHPHQVVEVNTVGTLNVLTAARENNVRRLVHTSTSEVYGTARTVPIDENHPKQPQSPYSASKIAADALALSFFNSFSLPVTICRPFNTYGPRQSDRAIIPTLLSQALMKDELVIGNSRPTRDFTYVADTVEGFLKLATSDAAIGEEINLGTGKEISIGELVLKIKELVGRDDLRVTSSEERIRPEKSEVLRLCSDNSKAKKLADWEPAVSLSEGLRRTLEWVKSQPSLYDPHHYRI